MTQRKGADPDIVTILSEHPSAIKYILYLAESVSRVYSIAKLAKYPKSHNSPGTIIPMYTIQFPLGPISCMQIQIEIYNSLSVDYIYDALDVQTQVPETV